MLIKEKVSRKSIVKLATQVVKMMVEFAKLGQIYFLWKILQ